MPSSNETDVTIALTNGTRTSPGIALDRQQFTGRGVQHLGDDADIRSRRRPDPKAFQLVVVVGVGLVDGRQVIGVDDEQTAAQRVGGVAVGHSGQSHQQPPTVLTHAVDDIAALLGRHCHGIPWRAT